MLLKGFPDFIQYNNTQAAKGRPKVSWPEFQRLRKGALIRQEASTSLTMDVHGHSIRLLPPPQESLNTRPSPSHGLSEDILELTPEMEVSGLPECVQVHALCDGSGPIGSI